MGSERGVKVGNERTTHHLQCLRKNYAGDDPILMHQVALQAGNVVEVTHFRMKFLGKSYAEV